jgi:L-aspartate oxidase
VRDRFPTIAEMCGQVGLDLATDPIPVGPAAHYIMGGIDTDEWGRTSLAGLYAAGETACTGVHGANRLASNSLLEGLVFGARAAAAMQQPPRPSPPKPGRVEARPPVAIRRPPASSVPDVGAVRDLMWRCAGLFRTREGLEEAVVRLDAASADRQRWRRDAAADAGEWRDFNLLTVARLIARAALRREESRGGHFRSDFPERDDRRWKIHVVESQRTQSD